VRRALALELALAVLVSPCGSCAAVPDPEQAALASPPDRGQFIEGGVNDFMERRCGTLDCHGQIGRPLRIYSAIGLRKTDPNTPFAERPIGGTTEDEKIDNYLSVIDLEPEAIGNSNATKGEYDDFLLLRKPLGIENEGVRHKGGPVLRSVGDPGFRCLRTWIAGAVSSDDCRKATF
jgi:hypothetical protein